MMMLEFRAQNKTRACLCVDENPAFLMRDRGDLFYSITLQSSLQ